MPRINDLGRQEKFRVLVFGPYKSYKTSGAATFPRPNFLDFDGGLAPLKAKWWRERYNLDPSNIMYETFKEKEVTNVGVVTKHTAFDEAGKYFEECMKEKGTWKGQPVGRDMFDTWIIDSGTTLFDVARNKAIILLGGTQLSPKPLSFTHKGALETGLVVPKQQDFGAERSMAEQFIDRVMNSGKHFVLLCHDKEEWNDEGTAVVRRVPLLTGQSVQRVCVKFDEVYYITSAKRGPNVITSLKTRDDGVVKCGSRYGLPDGTEWSWQAITAALKPLGWDFESAPTTAAKSA